MKARGKGWPRQAQWCLHQGWTAIAEQPNAMGSVAAIRERLVRRILLDKPANEGRVPWSPRDEAAHDNAQILGLPAGVEQLEALGESAAPPSANTRSLVGPQNARVGEVASPQSSDSMQGLGRLPPKTTACTVIGEK